MIYEVVMPRALASPWRRATQLRPWHKKLGDRVEKGEMLFALETDKAAMDVESTDVRGT